MWMASPSAFWSACGLASIPSATAIATAMLPFPAPEAAAVKKNGGPLRAAKGGTQKSRDTLICAERGNW
jgi:hypothetical protein